MQLRTPSSLKIQTNLSPQPILLPNFFHLLLTFFIVSTSL
ncbi:hypothetical protein B4064_3556 [Caldibacillus thermoamylovorans]|uniref:Uncharacterized protein n=1 Tax=Caldibacillus thermoamylovorans TaxID=35841 RepID=A0A0D0FDL2_9BACI|nr:hypothetical protein B4065_3730 [Caldibacillus thermoamylovorans]KIO60371.1 hypothetical protein B4064_3556 [Caldibacillus thermoamylovorans]KIO62356.1 hypothetical protein B4166_3359 [Caldibacillus thermoamylovorans]KIO71883.1 hypothetical protein B4167_3286 [Caldibacillus thermoamylovorans]